MENPRVLVVDDSKDFVFLLSSLLKFHKIAVNSFSNPLEALEFGKNNSVSLILTDYMMDEMDGLTLIDSLYASVGKDKLKSILLTSKDLEAQELEKLNSLGCVYLKKPILPNEIHKKIVSLLG